MGDSVHAEGQLLAWVLQQLTALREGLGNHLALLDPLGLIITLPSQPENRRGGLSSRGTAASFQSTPRMQGPDRMGTKAVARGQW